MPDPSSSTESPNLSHNASRAYFLKPNLDKPVFPGHFTGERFFQLIYDLFGGGLVLQNITLSGVNNHSGRFWSNRFHIDGDMQLAGRGVYPFTVLELAVPGHGNIHLLKDLRDFLFDLMERQIQRPVGVVVYGIREPESRPSSQ
jgi:hypothetical protein